MKITLRQLHAANESQALAHLSSAIPPGGYHFHVAHILDAVANELRLFERQRVAIFKRFGTRKSIEKDGKLVEVLTVDDASPENASAFTDAMEGLLDTEADIQFPPISWSRLGPAGQNLLTVNDVRALGPLLIED